MHVITQINAFAITDVDKQAFDTTNRRYIQPATLYISFLVFFNLQRELFKFQFQGFSSYFLGNIEMCAACLCTPGGREDRISIGRRVHRDLKRPSIQHTSRPIVFAKPVLYLSSWKAWQNTSFWWKIDIKKFTFLTSVFYFVWKEISEE
jgi:hypothetical protein